MNKSYLLIPLIVAGILFLGYGLYGLFVFLQNIESIALAGWLFMFSIILSGVLLLYISFDKIKRLKKLNE
jgi:Mg2+/citrate symporter